MEWVRRNDDFNALHTQLLEVDAWTARVWRSASQAGAEARWFWTVVGSSAAGFLEGGTVDATASEREARAAAVNELLRLARASLRPDQRQRLTALC